MRRAGGTCLTLVLAAVASFSGGCAARKQVSMTWPYLVQKLSGRDFIFPPNITPKAEPADTIAIPFHNFSARKDAAARGECAIRGEWFSFVPDNSVKSNWTASVPSAHAWMNNGTMVLRDAWTEFVGKLHKAQESGCFAPASDVAVETMIAEGMPLPIENLQFFHYWSGSRGGQFDLGAGMHLRIERVLFRDPAATTREPGNFVGSRTVSYEVMTAGEKAVYLKRDNVAIEPKGVRAAFAANLPDTRLAGEFGRVAALRMFLLTEFVPTKLRRLALLVAARDTRSLDEMTDAVHAHSELGCEQGVARQVSCVSFSGMVSVTAELDVTVQGEKKYFQLGSLLRDALPKGPEALSHAFLATVRIQRRFQGRYADVQFNPADEGVLKLALLGGDRITFLRQ